MEGILADDVLLCEILIRLPTNSLLRFRCVCKSWYRLISTSGFVSAHTNQIMKRNTIDHVVLLENRKCLWKVYKDNDRLLETTNLDFPSLSISRCSNSFVMKGCINGLICVLLEWPETLILWNPFIRRYFTLPEPIFGVAPTTNVISAYSFGYGPLTNDYKIIRNLRPYTQTSHCQELGEPLGEICRLSTGTWQSLEVPSSLPLVDQCEQAHLNGAIHWLTSCCYRNLVIAFDVDVEAFKEIELPEDLKGDPNTTLSLEAWHGSLSILEVRRHHLADIRLWVMKEYGDPGSWTTQLVINYLGISTSIAMVRRSGKVLLTEVVNPQFLLYDPETNHLEKLEIKADLQALQMASYQESLVLLDHQDAKTY